MTWVKICGITNLEDALTAVGAGADALGFVFYEKSPRYVSPEVTHAIVRKLPQQIEKVGVFAGDGIKHCVDTAKECGLAAVQVHISSLLGSSPSASAGLQAVCSPNPVRVYLAWPIRWLIDGQTQPDFRELLDTIFLDSGTSERPGGTAQVFDWRKAAPVIQSISSKVKVVVAGGLTPTNVAEAMRILKPWGVDVASGVEATPGKKDPQKVRAFISAVREAEKTI
jgi:phosphoribosylanthranilate isomerase